MKKKLLAVLLSTAMVASLFVGCGSSSTATAEETKTEETTQAVAEETKTPVEDKEEAAEEKTETTEVAETTDEASAKHDYSSYKPAKTEYNLVFIPKLVHTWYEGVKTGIDEAVAELKEQGITVNYVWDAPADAVVTDQTAKLEANAATQPDGISAAIIDPSAETQVINDIIAAGINVTTFDVDAPDSNRTYYCGHSTNYQDGYDMAKVLADELGNEGQVAILSGSLSASNHIDRVQGFKDYMTENTKIEIVDEQPDNDSVEDALSITEGYLSTYPDLKGVFGCNGAAPNGACRAIKDAGKSGQVLVVGMAEDEEAAGYLKDGTMFCTLKQNVPSYGYNSVYNMMMIADGQKPIKVEDDIPADFITKDNVDDYDWN